MKRRRFLRLAGGGLAGGLLLPEWLRAGTGAWHGGPRPTPAPAESIRAASDEVRLVILHTNDTHSRIDPFPRDGGPYAGLGGVARRAALVEGIRDRHPHVLLLDAGDIFQGTPYFNFFDGEIELRTMSEMGYDVATPGNHDFDNGVDGLVRMMPHATFDFVSANYDVTGTPLEEHVRPWVVRETGGVRVGIFGLGIAFDGLVLASLHRGVSCTDPFEAARRAVVELRERGCDLVVCLSHLGYRYRGERPSDTLLARRVEGIDLILGGHTHTFMHEPDVHAGPGGHRTLVHQVGWAGMRLGRIDIVLGPRGAGGKPGSPPRAGKSAFAPRRWAGGSYSVDETLE